MGKAADKVRTILGSDWLPWTIAVLVLLVALLEVIWLPRGAAAFSASWQAALAAIVLLMALMVIGLVSRYMASLEEQQRLTKQLAAADALVAEAYQWLEAILHVNQKFVEASDENQVVTPVLRLLVEISAAQGAAFIPFDEHGQPQAAFSYGEAPAALMDAWLDYLVSPEVRERCRTCAFKDITSKFTQKPADCPLLTRSMGSPFSPSEHLLCLPVRGGEREYGIVTLFVVQEQGLDMWKRQIIQALLDETALGLEGVRLRRRELAAIRQMQVLRPKTDLTRQLEGLLESVFLSLDADFALLVAPGTANRLGVDLAQGSLTPQARLFIDGIFHAVMTAAEPVSLGDVEGASEHPLGVRSLLAAPLLLPDGSVVGVLAAGSQRSRFFRPRQLVLLQTVTGQAALVVQNADLMAELEYKTMIQERARLAREIHDGLAQMIGFLKLQAAQLRLALGRDDLERARQTSEVLYNTLSETYQDARQAIDGLRVSPAECGLVEWLKQTGSEFQESSEIRVDLQDVEPVEALAPEVHAQLIRIVQEALSNVRKHARAQQVWIACQQVDDALVLEVRDDGEGFEPEAVSFASRYGLRGMRERADLLGATLEVISRLREGTIVRIRLPLQPFRNQRQDPSLISGSQSSLLLS